MSWMDERIKGTGTDIEGVLREIHTKAGNMLADLNIADTNWPTVDEAYKLATMTRRLEKVCHQHWTYRDVEDHAPAPGQPLEDPSKASLYLTVAQRDATIKRLEDELGRGARDA